MASTALTVTGPGRFTLTNTSGAGAATIAGQLQQTGGLSVSGVNNTVTLSGNNTYTGGTTISGGATAVVDVDNRLGNAAGSVTLDAGRLRMTNTATLTPTRPFTLGAGGGTIELTNAPFGFSGSISGSGGLTKTGTGLLGLLAANSYTGPTTLLIGATQVLHNQALQNSTLVLAGGTIQFFTSSPVVGGLAGSSSLNVSSANNLVVGNNNSSNTYSGSLSGFLAGGLQKTGTGVWTLTGNNTNAGSFNIQAGTVVAGSPGAMSPNLSITISPGAALDLGGFDYTMFQTGGITLFTGGVLRLGGAGLTIAQFSTGNFYGNVQMQSGMITTAAGGTTAFSGASVRDGFIAGGGTQYVTGANTFTNITTVNGSALSASAGSTLNLINCSLGGALVSSGTVNWTNGSVSSSGALTANATINTTGFANDGMITVNSGGVLSNAGSSLVSGGGSIFTIAAGGSVQLNGTNFDLHGALLSNNGTIAGGTLHIYYGALAAGTGDFGSVVIHPGGAFTPGFSLANIPAPAPASIGVITPLDPNQINSSPITLLADTTATVSASNNTLVLAGAISAPGRTLTKNDLGTLALGSLRASALAINGGTAKIIPNGTASGLSVVGALIIAGAPDAWTARLDLTDNAMIIDYGASSPLATVQNQIKSAYADGSWPGFGITSSSAAVASASAHKTALGYAEALELGVGSFFGQPVDGTSLLVRYTFAGDANLDGAVDTIDFNLLAASFSLAAKRWNHGDFNYDGSVDTIDFNLLASNFGQDMATEVATPGVGALVPEPSAAMFYVALSCIALRSRGHRFR